MTPDDITAIREKLAYRCHVYATLCPGANYLAWLADKTGYSVSYLRSFRSGRRQKDNSAVAEAIKEAWERKT